jgi:hypothetical protein
MYPIDEVAAAAGAARLPPVLLVLGDELLLLMRVGLLGPLADLGGAPEAPRGDLLFEQTEPRVPLAEAVVRRSTTSGRG